MAVVSRRRKADRVDLPLGKEQNDQWDKDLQALANRMAHAQRHLQKAQAEVALVQSEAVALMNAKGRMRHESIWGVHEITIPLGRPSRTIDKKKYAKLVSKEQFNDTIEVMIGKAQKILSKLQLEAISIWTPGKEGTPTYSFKPSAKFLKN